MDDDGAHSPPRAASGRKKAFRFTAGKDVDLLKEIINIKPFDAPHGQTMERWKSVASNLCVIYGDRAVTHVTTKARFTDIMDAFH